MDSVVLATAEAMWEAVDGVPEDGSDLSAINRASEAIIKQIPQEVCYCLHYICPAGNLATAVCSVLPARQLQCCAVHVGAEDRGQLLLRASSTADENVCTRLMST